MSKYVDKGSCVIDTPSMLGPSSEGDPPLKKWFRYIPSTPLYWYPLTLPYT